MMLKFILSGILRFATIFLKLVFNLKINKMTLPTKLTLTIITPILLCSYAPGEPEQFLGTYGVSAMDTSDIQLTIQPDHTFHYKDYSNPERKIIRCGTWTTKGKHVVLKDNAKAKKFHHIWKFTHHGQVAKSRKGLTFYRLCKISN